MTLPGEDVSSSEDCVTLCADREESCCFPLSRQISAKLLENRRVAAQLQLILYVFEVFPSEKSILPSWVECRPLYWVADITVLPMCLTNKGGLSGTWPGRASFLARCITE